jgi:hypothetical protein
LSITHHTRKRPSTGPRTTHGPQDESPSLGDAQDGLGMTDVAADRPKMWIQVITTSSIRSNQRFLDQPCSSKSCMWGRKCLGLGTWHGGRCGRTWHGQPHLQGWPCQVVRSCLARVARWFHFPHKCVLVHKNYNTTHGTLLVSKMCMKLVVYSSRTRGFDGRNFVVKIVNKLPQAKRLLVHEQSLDLASVDQGLQDVITRQVPVHKLHALLANLKRLVREKLSITSPVGLLAFHLAFRGWKVEWILTLHLSLSSFSWSYLRVFENFAKKDKVPRMVPSIAQVVFITSPKALSEPQLPTSMACMWSFG